MINAAKKPRPIRIGMTIGRTTSNHTVLPRAFPADPTLPPWWATLASSLARNARPLRFETASRGRRRLVGGLSLLEMGATPARRRQLVPPASLNRVLHLGLAGVDFCEFDLRAGQALFGGGPQPPHGLGANPFDGFRFSRKWLLDIRGRVDRATPLPGVGKRRCPVQCLRGWRLKNPCRPSHPSRPCHRRA